MDRSYRIRVNCKFNPEDTHIKMPPAMEKYAKTTMVRYCNDPHWRVFEDRVYAKAWKNVPTHDIQYMCIFLQPVRKTYGGRAFYANLQEFDTVTMNSKQRVAFNKGIENVNKEDDMMRTCLRTESVTDRDSRLIHYVYAG